MQDVVIVGAGAAGVGCGVMLRCLGFHNFTILEREHVGSTFECWPEGMRFITPSFPGNVFGALDLNAVTPSSSPALTLQMEHPTGTGYAKYLQALAREYSLPVQCGVDVEQVEAGANHFRLHTSRGPVTGKTMIWATGEYRYPNLSPFPGAELCLHTSQVTCWDTLGLEDRLVIGAGESGMEAALQLTGRGVNVTLVDESSPWTRYGGVQHRTLSPRTRDRMARMAQGRKVSGFRVCQVALGSGSYRVSSEVGAYLSTDAPPLLATGFTGGLALLGGLVDWTESGDAIVSAEDESTRTPGLFITGPRLRHGELGFPFIYQFRQRFAVIGRALARRFGFSEEPLTAHRGAGMYLDDLRSCTHASRA